MRIKWTSVQDLVARNCETAVAPTSTREREAVKEALKREGRLQEHMKSIARARARVRKWFKED